MHHTIPTHIPTHMHTHMHTHNTCIHITHVHIHTAHAPHIYTHRLSITHQQAACAHIHIIRTDSYTPLWGNPYTNRQHVLSPHRGPRYQQKRPSSHTCKVLEDPTSWKTTLQLTTPNTASHTDTAIQDNHNNTNPLHTHTKTPICPPPKHPPTLKKNKPPTQQKPTLLPGTMNESQIQAIDAALSRSITLWQGPPGTGKTKTLAAFVAAAVQLLRTTPTGPNSRDGPPRRCGVLAVAASNTAVDNMVQALLAQGLQVVRVGQPVRVAESVRNVTLEARIRNHPLGVEAAAIRTRMASGGKGGGKGGDASAASWQRAVQLEEQAAGVLWWLYGGGCMVVCCGGCICFEAVLWWCVRDGDGIWEGRVCFLYALVPHEYTHTCSI